MHLPRLKPPISRLSIPPLLVSEIFASVQGEGPFTGRPSIFLRLGVCNLSCSWCDTPYTWLFTESRLQKVHSRAPNSQPTLYSRQSELTKRTAEDLYGQLVDMAGTGIRNIVVTGGEPLLHKKPLLSLLPAMLDNGFKVEIETNGTISPLGLPPLVHLNVSPKLANSDQPFESRIRMDALTQCLQFSSSVLKFVVSNDEDLRELRDLVDEIGVESERVFLMPLGTDSESIRERGKWLVDVCMRYGYHYSHRVHVELWGDKRGV